MRNTDIKICESILRDYHDLQSARKMRELEIMTRLPGERVEGGEDIPPQQRVMEDPHYVKLSKIVEGISSAVRSLPPSQQKAVILIYFVGMDREQASMKLHCGYATVRRWCVRAIEEIHVDLLAHYHAIVSWRNEVDAEILAMLKS